MYDKNLKYAHQKLDRITQKEFYNLWRATQKPVRVDEKQIYDFFVPYIKSIPKLVLDTYYWQIFNNDRQSPKILAVQGDVEKLTPADAKYLLEISASEFYTFYHPDDLNDAFTFVAMIFQFIFDLPESERTFLNVTIYIRIRNGEGNYHWNSLQYPALYFDEENNFLYGMALYTDVHHLIDQSFTPTMTVLDSRDPDKMIFTQYNTSQIQGVHKIYPKISKREKEIISLLSQGQASKQIADILGISKNTVDNHRQRLLKKFDAHSSSEMVMKALLI